MKATISLIILALLAAYCYSAAVPFVWVEGGNDNFPSTASFRHRHSVLEDSNGDLWLFGGNAGCALPVNELWKMTVRSNYTWNQIVVPNGPGPRADVFSWIDSHDNLYFFGGRSGCNDSLSDLWMFNTTSLSWSELAGNGTLNRGNIGTGTSTTHPGPRVGHANWIVNDNELWFYGGGLAGLNTIYHDVWKFSLTTKIWTCLLDQGMTEAPWIGTGQPSFRMMANTDINGTVWIVDTTTDFTVFARFKPATLDWTIIGNYSSNSFGQLGVFSTDNHPVSGFLGSIVYAGDGILALTSVAAYDIVRHWHYKIATNEWALMFGPLDDTVPALHYGTFQEIDSTNAIGTRHHFGQSLTKGNTWIVRGYNGNDTWVFPVNRCGTDIDPCDVNAQCVDNIGWTECTCNEGYEGTGYKCTVIPPPTPVSTDIPTSSPEALVPSVGSPSSSTPGTDAPSMDSPASSSPSATVVSGAHDRSISVELCVTAAIFVWMM